LLTSVGDFERIYGGLNDLGLGRNYMAHAVNAYFDNGGSRLYVSRVYSAKPGKGGFADSGNLSATPANAATSINFLARFPGSGLSGTVTLRLAAAPITATGMQKAPNGIMVRTGGKNLAQPGTMEGGIPPFFVDSGSQLTFRLTGEANDRAVTFKGSSAEATGAALALDATGKVTIADADKLLTVTLAGVKQNVTLTLGAFTPSDLAAAINVALRGGYAKIVVDANPNPNSNHLVIGCDKRGRLSSAVVEINAKLSFAAQTVVTNANDPTMLPDLNAVTAQDVDSLTSAQKVRATYSVDIGRMVLTTVDAGGNVGLTITPTGTAAVALQLTTGQEAKGSAGDTPQLYVKSNNAFTNPNANPATLNMAEPDPTKPPNANISLLSITATMVDGDGNATLYDDLHFGGDHPRWIANILKQTPTRLSDQMDAPYWLSLGAQVDPFGLLNSLFPNGAASRQVTVMNGDDGNMPGAQDYAAALAAFKALENISIVATPGGSSYTDSQGIMNALISHAEERRSYRIAVVDLPPAQTVDSAGDIRGKIDSTYAAMYFPWVVIPNPLYRPGADDQPREIIVPPSGAVCGIYARNDIENSVAKAPANEIVRGALRFEIDVTFGQQEVLNPIGVNCLRYLTGRGYRVWGARTASSDPEWKYVNVRRYFNYLESSIDQGTQWAVFENNGERLWNNITETISSFLQNEWVNGNLLGDTAQEAFFVRCDRSTMTQNDLDNGRLVCLIGVAALKPAEFVIFRIGQKTLDSRT
jgi:hypothetical protein